MWARIQSRIGPNRVEPQGFLQCLADGLKNLLKEDIIPKAADKVVFLLAPVVATIPAFLTFAVIPFGGEVEVPFTDITTRREAEASIARLASEDPLTGLHNRRYMSRHLDTLLANAKKNERPLAFVIMDIDFFKQVNDTYGHDIGDEMIEIGDKRGNRRGGCFGSYMRH